MSKINVKFNKHLIFIGSILLLISSLVFYSFLTVKKKYCYSYNGVFITEIQKPLFTEWSVHSSSGKIYYTSDFFNHLTEPNGVYIFHPKKLNTGVTEYEIFSFNKKTFQGVYINGAMNINYDKIKNKKTWMYCIDTKIPTASFGVG